MRVCIESRSKADNKLFYGDNLDVLRRYVRDESVDLIYLDPPFNSRQDYNVLFAEKDGTRSSSQITAFEDTWEWNLDAERAYQEVVERGGWVGNLFVTWLYSMCHVCSVQAWRARSLDRETFRSEERRVGKERR